MTCHSEKNLEVEDSSSIRKGALKGVTWCPIGEPFVAYLHTQLLGGIYLISGALKIHIHACFQMLGFQVCISLLKLP